MGHNFGNGVPRKIVICEDGRYYLFESIFFQWGRGAFSWLSPLNT